MANYFGLPDMGADDFNVNDWMAAVNAWQEANPGRIPLGHEFGLTDGDMSYLGNGVTDLNSLLNIYQGAGTYGTDDASGIDYYQTNSGQVNPFPEVGRDNFMDQLGLYLVGGIAGGGLLAGAGGLGAAGGLTGDALGLTQMGQAAGLEGAALDAFVQSGGTLGSTAAGGGGVGTGVLDAWGANPRADGLINGADYTSGLDSLNLTPDSTTLGTSSYGGTATEGLAKAAADAASQGIGSQAWNYLKQVLGNPTDSLLRTLISSGVQGITSYMAARTQAKAGEQANQTLWNMYNQNRADLEPWRTAGVGALGRLTDMTTPGKQFTTMQADPGYQFRLDQGQQALDNRARAAGKFYSGSGLQGAADYNQNFASNEFNNVFNRNASLAGLGQTATNTTAGLGANTANNVAGVQQGIGNARASGYVGLGNAVQGGIAAYEQSQMLNRLLPLLARGY